MNGTLNFSAVLVLISGVLHAGAQADGNQWQVMAEAVSKSAQQAAPALLGPFEIRHRNLSGVLQGDRSDAPPSVHVTELKLDDRALRAKADVLIPVQLKGGAVSPGMKYVAEGMIVVEISLRAEQSGNSLSKPSVI